jgi:hypothetical protein
MAVDLRATWQKYIDVALLLVFLAGGMMTVVFFVHVRDLEQQQEKLRATITQVRANALTLRQNCEADNKLNAQQRKLWNRLVIQSQEQPSAEPADPARLAQFQRWLDEAYETRACPP